MCSRYCLTSPPETVRAHFGYRNAESFPPRYNIAPSQPVEIVRLDHKRERELTLVRWGLIPSWVKEPGQVSMINARAETAAEKPSFRGAMRHRRCLIPADGYYEWQGANGQKRPYLLRPKAGGPIALAGLWEHWLGADGSEIETMAVLTVQANAAAARVHDRMPVILAPDQYETWLDVSSGHAGPAAAMLAPPADDVLEIVEVGARLNNPRNEGPDMQDMIATKPT